MLSLALKSARRNWTRSALAIVGMALAAGVLTAAHSVTSGYFSSGYLMPRTFMAGDIIVLPGHMYLDPSDLPADVRLEWSVHDMPFLNDLADLHPHILTDGVVQPSGAETAIDIGRLPAALTDHPQVSAVNPYHSLPAWIEPDHYAPLRGRDIEEDLGAWAWDEAIIAGRYFRPGDDGEPVALVAAPGGGIGMAAISPTYPTPAPGERLELVVPRLTGFSGGFPVFDYLDVQTVELEVVGLFRLTVGEVQVPGQDEPTEVLWDTPQVLVPAGTFSDIYRAISGTDPAYAHQLSVRVDRFFDSGQVAADLRRELPGWTVRTVPELMNLSERGSGQGAIPRDLYGPVTAAAYSIAGMLVVINMYLLNVQRRREIGIMKAVGASSHDIVAMVLTESVCYALLGGAIGFGAVRLVATVIMLLASVPLIEAGLSTAALGLRVGLLTSLAAALFALPPAVEAATTPTVEVLRDD